MTKFLLLSILIMTSAISVNAALLLAKNGKSDYVIVIPDGKTELAFPAGDSVKYAANFLNTYLQKSVGIKLAVKTETQAKNLSHRIFIGHSNFAKQHIGNLNKLHPEELVIKTVGSDIIICGEVSDKGIDRGSLFGVYEFLEKELSIRWFFGNERRWYPNGFGTIIPKHKKIVIKELNIRDYPKLKKRQGGVSYYCWRPEIKKQWHPVLRFGSSMKHENANHTQIGWTDLYAKTHPEYFASTRAGRRRINFRYKNRSYICLSNPDILKQMIENIKSYDRGKGPKNAWGPRPPEVECVYFACNDGMRPKSTCHCPECLKLLDFSKPYEAQGSELFFRFVSKYANVVKKNWPKRKLAVLAYSHYKAPPEKSKIPDNVDIAYVGPPIHYANNPEIYKQHLNYLKRWSELLGNNKERLSIWMNIVNPSKYISYVPFMYPNILKRWLHTSNKYVGGYFINGLNPYLRRLGERGRLGGIQTFPMVWMQSRLLWNPDADVNELLKDYCKNMYGPSAKTMYQFYQLIISRWEDFYQKEFDMSEVDFIHKVRYPEEQLKKLKTLLNKALQESAPKSIFHQRIAFFKDKIYSKFFEEAKLYKKRSGLVASYECYYVDKPPVIDGNMQEKWWQEAPVISLVKRHWGEKSDRESKIRIVHDGKNLYLLAIFEKSPTTSLDKEELRIDIANRIDPVKKQFSPNIDKRWPAFREIRINAQGKVKSYDRLSKKIKTVVKKYPDKLVIEAKIPLEDLKPGFKLKDSQELRMQFMRYWDIWKRYDLWNPTLTHISDYPTYRFGIINFITSSRKEAKSGLY